MKQEKIMENIAEVLTDDKALFTRNYYVIFFLSSVDGDIYVYDTKEPIRAVKDIMGKHPEFEYLRLEPYSEEGMVRSVTTAFRRVREARHKLIPQAEMIKITVEKI